MIKKLKKFFSALIDDLGRATMVWIVEQAKKRPKDSFEKTSAFVKILPILALGIQALKIIQKCLEGIGVVLKKTAKRIRKLCKRLRKAFKK